MTITKFLLARFAEDEALARRVEPQDEALSIWDEWPTPAIVISPARLLAECEAKRVIVHQQEAWDQDPTLLWVVQNLALPYADHPDYQQEWNPRGRDEGADEREAGL